jgi:phage terminase large subunit-like protein
VTSTHAHSGNRKSAENLTSGPWADWPETDRADRCIRFIETYCRWPKGYFAGQTVKLAPFQKAWLRAVLAPGVSSAAMQIARGNGKSSLLACVALWALFDPDPAGGSPQVPIVATRIHQAVRSVYGVAVAMIKAQPELQGRCILYTASNAPKVIVEATGGEMFPVSNDVDGLQGLDPSLAVCDEIGFMPLDSWNSLLLAGIKRPSALVVGIGTPGLDQDNALFHLRLQVHEGNAPPGFHYTEFAASPDCRVDDEVEWARANPALAEGFMNLDAIRTNLGMAPEGRFRVFHLAQWIDGVDAWVERRDWDALIAPYKLVSGSRTWIGLDVGVKRDSTAMVTVQRRPDGRLHAACRLWLPTADEAVPLTDIMQAVRLACAAFDVEAVAYDPRLFEVPAQMLADERYPMVEMPQSLERMTPAFGQLFEMIKRGELSHDGDRPFTQQILSAIPRYNERGFTLQKAKSRGRIDACYALAMAVDRALHSKPPKSRLVVL